jgi:catechol 2,3-dioxygenase-like lactoylglutathione lyase family enzyme
VIDQQPTVGIHHMGVTVSNLERSIDFYTRLGFRLLFSPLQYSGKDLEKSLNVEGAKLRSAMLKASDGTMVELLQYLEPEGRALDRRNCDLGSMHIAFRVPDIETAFSEFKKTVHFNSEPSTVSEGPLKGIKFVYFVDPDGVILEFFQESPESISSKD